jgi:hypothetical protein
VVAVEEDARETGFLQGAVSVGQFDADLYSSAGGAPGCLAVELWLDCAFCTGAKNSRMLLFFGGMAAGDKNTMSSASSVLTRRGHP